MEFISKYWEAIIALSALATSILATIISFKLFKLKEIHFRKSVKPMLQIGQWDYENNLMINVIHSGLGPAVINEIVVFKNKHERKTCIYDWLPKKLPGTMNFKEYWTGHQNFVINVNQEIKLIEISIDTTVQEQIECREQIRGILRDLTVKITYSDFYDKKIEDKEMSLRLFARADNVN